jgi:hypothetical protein
MKKRPRRLTRANADIRDTLTPHAMRISGAQPCAPSPRRSDRRVRTRETHALGSHRTDGTARDQRTGLKSSISRPVLLVSWLALAAGWSSDPVWAHPLGTLERDADMLVVIAAPVGEVAAENRDGAFVASIPATPMTRPTSHLTVGSAPDGSSGVVPISGRKRGVARTYANAIMGAPNHHRGTLPRHLVVGRSCT